MIVSIGMSRKAFMEAILEPKETQEMKRFIETTAESIGEEPDEYVATKWWLDTNRPINEPQGYVAVQTYADKNANDFVPCSGMRILFTDQAEYYFVCQACHSLHGSDQWSGSTRSSHGWRERAEAELKEYEATKGWCEFCDPIFGNGGWV